MDSKRTDRCFLSQSFFKLLNRLLKSMAIASFQQSFSYSATTPLGVADKEAAKRCVKKEVCRFLCANKEASTPIISFVRLHSGSFFTTAAVGVADGIEFFTNAKTHPTI